VEDGFTEALMVPAGAEVATGVVAGTAGVVALL
jgi:hypothetical protein